MNLVSGTALACILVYAIFTNFVGIGMAPVLKCIPGELFIYGKSQSKNIVFERGETYVFRWPFQTAPGFGQSIVKRLAGVPGDRIRVDAKGVWINDALWGPLNERVYTKMKLAPNDFMHSYTLGADEFLMLGTLPDTFDGRYIGPIKRHSFVGHVWVVL
jgi:conjugal transfer pilin signal peptidase TrbI